MHTFSKRSAANRSVPRHLRDSRPCPGVKIPGGPCKDDRWPYHIRTGLGNPDGPEIPFIHGFSQGHPSWIKQMRSE